MHRWKIVVCLFVLLAMPVVALAADNSDLVAKVGNIKITKGDYEREIQKLLPMQVGYHGGIKPEKVAQIKKDALQNLIDRAYEFQYAVKEEISIDSEEFSKLWDAYLAKRNAKNLSDAEVAEMRAGFYQELLAKKAEEEAVDSKIVVTDEQVKSHFEKNREMFKEPKKYTASHIFIKVDPSASLEEKSKLRERAQKLYERAAAGEDFYNLAYYNSDDRSRYVGGSLGQFKAGQTVREFDKELSKMKVGEISKPIQTIYGFHIIKLDAVEPERYLTFDEVASLMRQQYREMQRKKVYQSWMDELKKEYPLEVYISE